MYKNNIKYPMKKRGQFIELIGIVLIIGIALAGTTGVYLNKDLVYVADTTNMNLYKYSECKELINQLNKEDIVVYNSIKKAEEEGYHLIRCKG